MADGGDDDEEGGVGNDENDDGNATQIRASICIRVTPDDVTIQLFAHGIGCLVPPADRRGRRHPHRFHGRNWRESGNNCRPSRPTCVEQLVLVDAVIEVSNDDDDAHTRNSQPRASKPP